MTLGTLATIFAIAAFVLGDNFAEDLAKIFANTAFVLGDNLGVLLGVTFVTFAIFATISRASSFQNCVICK